MGIREYTPQRRRIMQLVMCGILAATVILAALVTRSANRANRVELSTAAFAADNVRVRLPLQWKAQAREKSDARVIAQAIEPPAGEKSSSSVIRVLADRIETPMSPLKYLRDNFGVRAPDERTSRRARRRGLQDVFAATALGPASAIVVGTHQQQAGEDGQPTWRHDIYAAAVFPSLQVLVVHLAGEGEIDLLDELVVQQVAAGIEISDAGDADPPSTMITLPAGIQLQPPSGFVSVQKRDTNRTDRLLWRTLSETKDPDELEQDWTSVEVVACIVSPREENPEAAMQTLLLAREPGWHTSKVMSENGVWRAERTEGEFAASAYLVPDRSGRALLAVFRGGAEHGPDFDSEWKSLASSVRFLPASDTSQIERDGVAEASRILGRNDFLKLFGERDEQWWLYTGPGNRSHIGWSNLKWQKGVPLGANVETRLRSFGGDVVTRIAGDWTFNPNDRTYIADLTRTEPRVHNPLTLEQRTQLRGKQLSLSSRADTDAAMQCKMPSPPAFIPGGVLPMLIGELDPGPLLIRTDSFLDCESTGAPQPLGVIIRPGLDSARKVEDEDRPLRCVTAEVNGAGRVSRWYFRSTGELEIVELSGGVTLTPSDRQAIEFAFGKSGAMAP